MKINYLFALLAMAFIFTSCETKEDEVDITPPQIESVTINGISQGAEVQAGTDMNLDVHISDDVSLQEYKIQISNNFGSYGKMDTTYPYSYTEVFTVTGPVVIESHVLPIPENASGGPYAVAVTATDAAGNATPAANRSFSIVQDGQQEITVTAPDFASGLEFSRSSVGFIDLRGSVTSSNGLERLIMIIKGRGSDGHLLFEQDLARLAMEAPPSIVYEVDFNELSQDIYRGKTINIKSDTPIGTYDFTIFTMDQKGNRAISRYSFQITE